jgi:hypothetical protein
LRANKINSETEKWIEFINRCTIGKISPQNLHNLINYRKQKIDCSFKDLEKILFEEFKNPETEAVGNLIITETYDLVDSLADLFTLGIVRLYSVKINGDLYEKVSQPMPKLPDVLENPNQEKIEVKEEPMNEDTPKTQNKEETVEKKQNKKEKGKTNAKKK